MDRSQQCEFGEATTRSWAARFTVSKCLFVKRSFLISFLLNVLFIYTSYFGCNFLTGRIAASSSRASMVSANATSAMHSLCLEWCLPHAFFLPFSPLRSSSSQRPDRLPKYWSTRTTHRMHTSCWSAGDRSSHVLPPFLNFKCVAFSCRYHLERGPFLKYERISYMHDRNIL